MTVKVTLARSWTDDKGKDHAADATISVSEYVARQLILDGTARAADTTTTKES